jgi:RHS repeat-associated protein
MVDQSGFTVKYDYYDDGKLKELRDGQDNLIVRYEYYDNGLLHFKRMGNGTFTEYQYDPAGQLLHLINWAPSRAVNSRFDYEYDDDRGHHVCYDALGRRTCVVTLDGRTDYQYDLTGQLTGVTLPNGRTIEYHYDAAGNRTFVIDNGVRTDYVTNNLDQYTSIGTVSYVYDPDGNLIVKRDANQVSTYTYNDDNQLLQAVTPGGTSIYEYDPFGNRSAANQNGQRTEYLLDPEGLVDVVAEYTGAGNLIAHYVHGLGLAGRFDAANVPAYYDFDPIGSTAGLTGQAGSYVNRYSYLPFGERLSSTETISNPFAYVGQWGVMQESNGLNFMRARYYSPTEGRFLSIDPLRITPPSLYTYADNNPLQFIDPLGLGPNSFNPFSPCINHNAQLIGMAAGLGGNCGIPPANPAVPPGSTPPLCPGGPCPPGDRKQEREGGAVDPNDLLGPAGFGDAAFIPLNQGLGYTIRFENESDATAPAQVVKVSQQLDPNLDWSTFQLGDFGFGSLVFHVPEGRIFYSTRIDVRDSLRVFVDVTANFDVTTGIVQWVFTSLDPVTLDVPDDPLAGFLPPNRSAPEGEGFVSYTVQPLATLNTGTVINAQATVIFDDNKPINTPLVFNTIDALPPTSSVDALPDTVFDPNIPVSWSGQDDDGGSGIASFDIYVSVDGGDFVPWLIGTSDTSGVYVGDFGHTYGFYSVAIDNVGNREVAPDTAQAVTFVSDGTRPSAPSRSSRLALPARPHQAIRVGPREFAANSIDEAFALPWEWGTTNPEI